MIGCLQTQVLDTPLRIVEMDAGKMGMLLLLSTFYGQFRKIDANYI